MFQKLEDFYTQDIRIDLVSAAHLAALNPEHGQYRAAAERGAFVVSILQGDVLESVYAPRMARCLDTLADARSLYEHLKSENPCAACFDFVRYPQSGHAASDNLGAAPRTQ